MAEDPTNVITDSEKEKGRSRFDRGVFLLVAALVIIAILYWMWATYKHVATQSVTPTSTSQSQQVTGTNPSGDKVSGTLPVIHIGLDQPSKSWFLAKAGTVVSGDICVFDNDNNSKKTPIYDGQEGTADIVYLASDTYVWAEWGCYSIENANAQDIAALINNKLDNGFNSVRYFNGYNKLGGNTPTIISSKIDASNITLPSLTTTTTK